MKSISKKNYSKKIIVVLLIILLTAVAVALVFFEKNNKLIKKNENQTSNKQRADEIKKNSSKSSENSAAGLPENSSSTTSDQVQVDSSLSVVISSTLQENGRVDAKAQTSGSGTCVFEYKTSGDKPVINQVSVNGTTCESSIPEVQFAKLGGWNLNVTYYSNGQKAETNQNVTIN